MPLLKFGRAFALVLLLCESALLLYTGFAKLENPDDFAQVLGLHGLVAPGWLHGAAWLVIFTELVGATGTVGLLLLRPGSRWAVLLPVAIFSAFGAYAVGLVFFPPPAAAPCGCGLGADATSVADWPWIAVRSFTVASVTALSGLLLPAGGAGDASARSADRTQATVEAG